MHSKTCGFRCAIIFRSLMSGPDQKDACQTLRYVCVCVCACVCTSAAHKHDHAFEHRAATPLRPGSNKMVHRDAYTEKSCLHTVLKRKYHLKIALSLFLIKKNCSRSAFKCGPATPRSETRRSISKMVHSPNHVAEASSN